ncbi:MAG: BTAD domain-containing putative transcriptional regulator, partial [Stackebrandtia sp.]
MRHPPEGQMGDEVKFQVLGPLRVTGAEGDVVLRGRSGRLLLATLLARADRATPRDVLSEAIQDGRAVPPSAQTMRWHVHQLRRLLGEPDLIVYDEFGYRLRAAPGAVDSVEFEALLAQGAAARKAGRLNQAAELLESALALWRGEAYEELADAGSLREEATRLERLRLDAQEQRCAVRLELGDHETLVSELGELTARHPAHEKFRAQLMLALYRCGRQADALEAFREGREHLAEEYGLDPGSGLRELEKAILVADPALELDARTPAAPAPAPARLVPAELPADVAAFTGRSAEIAELDAALDGGAESLTISAISGGGGIGKSALAIRLAHRVADRFADGQLYLNLHGATPDVKPMEPAEALGRLLRSLGASDAADAGRDVEELAAKWRTATAGRRLLILLDDARDVAQLRPLLPGSPTCAVLITSRRSLTSLGDATCLRLDALPRAEALTLLWRLLGDARAQAAPDAAEELVRLCDGMPLALRVAAARLNERPKWTIPGLVGRLADETRRLGELAAADVAVRSAFAVSYSDLAGDDAGRQAARMFRMLGLHHGADISVPIAAALADVSDERAEAQLDVLADARLAECEVPGRYRLHDLLRLFARERADAEETLEARQSATRRMLHRYLATARACTDIVIPNLKGFRKSGPRELVRGPIPVESAQRAVEWVRAETANIAAVCRALPADAEAADAEAAGIAVGLSSALRLLSWQYGDCRSAHELCQIALELAAASGDDWLQYTTHVDLVAILKREGMPQEAYEHALSALRVKRRMNDDVISGPLCDLATVTRQLGRLEEAADYAEQALESARREGEPMNESVILVNQGLIHAAAGRVDAAVAALREAAEIARAAGVQFNY